MSNETMMTLQGYVGGDVQLRSAGETCVANIRVACTPRRYLRRTDEWVDAETQWYTVNAWRALGEHCARSLRRGDPVIVHGRLSARTYVNKNSVEVTTFEVEATVVGHDLTRGVSVFSRLPRPQSADPTATGSTGSDGYAGSSGSAGSAASTGSTEGEVVTDSAAA